MKKTFLILSMAAATAIGFSSCKEAVAKLIPSFTTGTFSQNFTVDAQTDLTLHKVASVTTTNSIQAEIDKNASGLKVDDFKKIVPATVTVTITNADATNNAYNFLKGALTVKSNTNSTPVEIATFDNTSNTTDAASNNTITFTVKDQDLKSYLNGNSLTFDYNVQLRRATKSLNCTLNVNYKVN